MKSGHELAPKFGYLRNIRMRPTQVRIEYNLHDINPFLSAANLEEMHLELDIDKYELFRTHWAVKEVNFFKELRSKGITLPSHERDITHTVDISHHIFDVALSFPEKQGHM